MKILVSILLSSFLLLASSNSNASLIGDEIFLTCMQTHGAPVPNCEGYGVLPAIVGNGIEYPDFFNHQNSMSIDVSANAIWVTFQNGPYCGVFTCNGQGYVEFWLTDLDWVDMPSGFITGINVITNMAGVLTSFDDHSVHFSIPEISIPVGAHLHIDIITDHHDISEPGIVMLLCIALLAFGIRKRQLA